MPGFTNWKQLNVMGGQINKINGKPRAWSATISPQCAERCDFKKDRKCFMKEYK